jgi:hypothetical protein
MEEAMKTVAALWIRLGLLAVLAGCTPDLHPAPVYPTGLQPAECVLNYYHLICDGTVTARCQSTQPSGGSYFVFPDSAGQWYCQTDDLCDQPSQVPQADGACWTLCYAEALDCSWTQESPYCVVPAYCRQQGPGDDDDSGDACHDPSHGHGRGHHKHPKHPHPCTNGHHYGDKHCEVLP